MMNYVKVCLVKVQLTSPKETLIWQILTFDGLRTFLGESWSTLDQMMNITSKSWCWSNILKFVFMLTIVDFLINTIDFQSFEPLTEQTCDVGIETWHGPCWGSMKNHGSHLRHFQSKFPWETQNPNCRPLGLGWGLTGQPLSAREALKECLEKKLGRQILGYNSCPCSIFLNPKS